MNGQTKAAQAAHADLAFLKGVVEGGGRLDVMFGVGYMAAGLVYGVQVLLQWAEYAQVVDFPPLGSLAVVTLPTILLVTTIIVLAARSREATPTGVPNRAIGAVFEATGLANLVIITVIGYIAIKERTFIVWMIYPCVIFAVQAAAWYVAFKLRRRLWHLAVALGWAATAIAMGLTINTASLNLYLAITTASLFLLMALPGAVIVHLARRSVS